MGKIVIKRDGTKDEYNREKIERVFGLSLGETKESISPEKHIALIDSVEEKIFDGISVEEVQDLIKKAMMKFELFDTAEAFILYRKEREEQRKKGDKPYGILSKEFLSRYKHVKPPFSAIGGFVYARTYAKWLPEKGRREYWNESVRRMVEFSCSLAPTTPKEAEKLFDNIFNLRQNLSGRMAFVGGSETSREHPLSLFNCAFLDVKEFGDFGEIFYLLMLGAGMGVRVTKDSINQLPKLRQNVDLIHKLRKPKKKDDRNEYTTTFHTSKEILEIVIGDSREGFRDAIDIYFKVLFDISYRNITTVVFNYNNIREKNERLKRFGGKSGGYEPLVKMFDKVHSIIVKQDSGKVKLKPIDCADIANIIGENVVSGNIRRTALIVLCDPDETDVINAKNDLYTQINGKWEVDKSILHRQMSNNTIGYYDKPSRNEFGTNFKKARKSGEPGTYNLKQALLRNPNARGLNPCGEIILDDSQCCNLTNINMLSFVREDGTYDEVELLEAQRLSARAGYRVTCMDLELPEWDAKQKRDRLLGVSLSGWIDFVNSTGITKDEQKVLLNKLRKTATDGANDFADDLGFNRPLLITTIKPSGTSSTLFGESAGVHPNHSEFYIRRVRLSVDDPLLNVVQELNYPISNEVGQTDENCDTKVVDFYMESPKGKTKFDISAVEQLETYKLMMKEYVQHNSSITVTVRNEQEWNEAEQWIWDNWDDDFVAVSLLSLDNNFYELLPFESITKDEYDKLTANVSPFNQHLLEKYEVEDPEDIDITDSACASGVCTVR